MNDPFENQDGVQNEVRDLSARAREFHTAAGGPVADTLAGWLAGQYLTMSREELAGAHGARRLEILRAFVRDWTLLRRGDHQDARLEFDWERLCQQMAARPGESEQIQVKNFHRGDAETRRECETGDGARERMDRPGDGGRGESNLVQVKNFHRGDAETRRQRGHAGSRMTWTGGWGMFEPLATEERTPGTTAVGMQPRWRTVKLMPTELAIAL